MDRSRQGWTSRLLSLLIALQAWTVVGLALLYLDPGGVPARLDCARVLRASAACLRSQEVVTDAWRMLHYWPLLGSIGLGYLAIVALFLRGPGDKVRRGAPARRAPRARTASRTTRAATRSVRT